MNINIRANILIFVVLFCDVDDVSLFCIVLCFAKASLVSDLAAMIILYYMSR